MGPLSKIARQLNNIAYEDLTKAERGIFNVLAELGILELNDEDDGVVVLTKLGQQDWSR